MHTTCWNHENIDLIVKCLLLQKSHFLDLVCSVQIVTITTWFSYSNRSFLKKWNFLDLIRSIHVETENKSLLFKFSLLKSWHFLDQVCPIHILTVTIGFSSGFSSGVSSKSGIFWTLYLQYMLKPWEKMLICHISSLEKVALSGPNMFNISSNH